MKSEDRILITIEPNKELSRRLGFTYYIGKTASTSDLLKQGLINEGDLAEMRNGKQICKQVKLDTQKEEG